jgi:hypothetical protein
MTLLESVVAGGVPTDIAQQALLKYDAFADHITNLAYFVIVDMTQSSNQKRFYLVNKLTGAVDSMEVAHGAGSDPQDTGWAKYFSNTPDSKMTSLGAYIIAERYVGKHGPSLRLDGLEDTNSNVRARDIVIHQASYVRDGSDKQGRSWGCPAVPSTWIDTVLQRLEGGAFMYIFGVNTLPPDPAKAAYEATRWNAIPRALWPDEGEGAPFNGE